MAPATPEPENAVRQYLLYLLDPSALRDEAAIAEAEAAATQARDPIERLKAFARLDRLRSVDGEHYRRAFVAHARAWADAEGIPAKAFLEAGVPAQDLVDAGIAAAPTRATSMPAAGRGRAPRLALEEVAAALPDGTFKLADLAAAIDREPGTTRNYLTKLITVGTVVELGDDPDHDGRGKPAKLYRRA